MLLLPRTGGCASCVMSGNSATYFNKACNKAHRSRAVKWNPRGAESSGTAAPPRSERRFFTPFLTVAARIDTAVRRLQLRLGSEAPTRSPEGPNRPRPYLSHRRHFRCRCRCPGSGCLAARPS